MQCAYPYLSTCFASCSCQTIIQGKRERSRERFISASVQRGCAAFWGPQVVSLAFTSHNFFRSVRWGCHKNGAVCGDSTQRGSSLGPPHPLPFLSRASRPLKKSYRAVRHAGSRAFSFILNPPPPVSGLHSFPSSLSSSGPD